MKRLLIEHVDALPLGEHEGLLQDVQIAIEGPTIQSLGPTAPEGFRPDERIDGRDHLALPGLFNAHCHAPMTLMRGWAEDLPFARWLNERIWVAEAALEREDVYWGAALAACEMLRAGVVGFADHYFWMDEVARVVEESGMKALLAWCYFGRGRAAEVGGITLETCAEFVRNWQGAAQGRIRTALGPHSPYMCPPEQLRQVAALAEELGAPVHIHLAESEEQVEVSRSKYGLSPVAHLEALGLLQGPTLAAHCLALDAQDRQILAAHRVTIAHTPKTYMKLAMPSPSLALLLGAGIPLALGTDGPASNSDLNLLEVMRLVGLQQKQQQGSAEVLPVGRLLQLGSRAGALALGFGKSGQLAAGAAADLVLLSTRGPHWYPRHNLAAAAVYAAQPADVRHVIVDGELLVRDGELLSLDEEHILYEAERRAFRLTGRRGMSQLRRYEG